MRSLRFWFDTFLLASQYNPPRFVELLMLMLAIASIAVSILFPTEKPYMVLGLSLVFGSAISILVRESMIPSHQNRVTQITALLLLITSLCGFADILNNG
ncbi:hypothetical protein [Calothrix sp. UHCC 0171]|uniref:hypothetical protein n=1 Tax=Calothrix sp. UHCC 0171 TaxID=3110245 RepID=UPI002B1FB71D|nr:hypothetical protein [Calothrix sp. UHCC 0171]MEA5573131.1 hypothetical protein [Calothrix sp. UHCC 0171]